MVTNLKRKISKKVLCVTLALTTVLSSTDFMVLAAEGQAELEAAATENAEDGVATKEEKSESDTTEDEESGSGETGVETGEKDSGEKKPEEGNETESPENPGEEENSEKPENPEDSDNGTDEETGEIGEDKPAEEPGEDSGEVSDAEQEPGEKEEEIADNVTAAGEEAVEASGQCGDNLTWTLKDGTLTISGTGEMLDYDRSSRYQNGKVTLITNAPWGTYPVETIKKLIINKGITYIGSNAFYFCSGLTGDLVIPEGVKTIGTGAFSMCYGFTGNLVIPESVAEIGDNAFQNCRFKGNLQLSKELKTIGYGAFMYCDNFSGNLVIPEGVELLGDSAFNGCFGFTGELIIPESVTKIGDSVFANCDFTGDLVIPESVTEIGNSAFLSCDGFTGDLVIPEGVTKIGDGAFSGCDGFAGNLLISESVKTIGNQAFYACSGFTGELVIPESVMSIGYSAFYNCSGFTGNLVIPEGIKVIDDFTFNGCSGFNGSLVLPEGMTEIGREAFNSCSGFKGNLIIPSSVTRIEYYAFDGCSGFTGNLVIPEGMQTIVNGAFHGCSSLNGKIFIPVSVTDIGSNVFGDILNRIIYGVLGSYAETYAKGNNIPFIPYNPNGPDNTPIELSHSAHIYVIDSDLGVPVAGALVNGTAADANGYIAIPVEEEGKEEYIGVTADGYLPDMSYKKLVSDGTYYINVYPSDGEFAIVYAKATIGNEETNLLADKVYLQHTENEISNASASAMMEIEVKARGDVANYTLIQDGALIASSAEGKFSIPLLMADEGRTLTNLNAQKDVRVKATDLDGKTTVKRIGIYISPEGTADIKEENKSGSFNLGSSIGFTLPDNTIPFLGGETLSYGLENALPFDLTVERNGQVKIAINKETSESMEAFKEDYDKLSKRAKNLSDAAAAFGGKPEKFGAGCLSAKVTVKGYGEGYIDMTKPGTFGIKVDVIVAGKGSAKYRQYFFAGSVPIYIDVEASAELSGKVTLSVEGEEFILQTEGGVGTLSGKISVTGKTGVGVEKVVSVGVSGTGACNYTWKPKDDYTKVWLNAYLELEADCFGWHMNVWKSPEATYTIYESKDPSGGEMGGRALTESMNAQLYNADAYTVMDRSYLNQEAIAPLTAFSVGGSDTFVQSSVYPGADPKLVRAGNKFYLFWLQDIPSRSAENRAAVVYAVSEDGANFTAPKQLVPESENQTHDNGIDVCVDGGKIYICWQDAAKTFASGTDLNEVAGNQYISYAVVDASTGEVMSNETVTETAGCYLQPQIYVSNGQVQIAWVQNSMTSVDGLWGRDNQESLQKYNAVTGEIETFPIGEGSEKIVSMDGAVGSSQAGVVYALDTDGDLQTVSDRVIYFDSRLGSGGSQTLLTAEAGMNDNPVAEGGRIFWYADGNISYTTVGSTAVQQIYEEARPDINSNFRILSEGERTEIIWDAIEYETEKVALYGISSVGEGQWTCPYVIEQTDSEMTGALTGSLRSGIPYIAYMHIRNQEDGSKSSSLCVTQKKDVTDLALTYAGYEYEDFKQGQILPISVELINKGNTTVETVEMKMDGVSLGTQDIHLDAGETGNFILEQYTVPAEMDSYGEHTLTVTADGEIATSDNDYQIGIGYTDVKVLCSQRWQDEATWLDLSVLNDSDIASDVTLNIRGDKEDGEILYSEELGEIADGKGVSMTVNLQPYEDSCCTYFVEAVTGTEDVIEGNNIVFVYTGFGTDVPGGVLVPDSKSYTVSFQSNGGSAVESQQIEEGRSASEPPVPSRDGYRFIGWYFNGEPYNFYLPITGDITLEAAWEEEHVLAAPSASFPSGSEVETGTKIVLTCAASGAEIYYTLDGTTPDRSSTLYREPIVVLGDTTIMAVAVREGYQDSPVVTFVYHAVNPEPDVYMVVFQSNGGTQINSQEVKAGETASRPEDPVREGYRFIGWYLDGELYDFASPVTGNIRLEAVWEEIDALDMPVSNIASGKAVPEGSKIILSTDQPGAKIYYTLDGTVPTDKALLYREPIVITEDTVIMAVAVKKGWKDSPVAAFRYTISVKKDDLGEILPEDFPEGGADAIPAGLWIAGVDEKGYTYTGKAIKPEVRVYDNKTLLQVKKDYTISYKNNIKAYDGTAGNKAPGIVVTGKGNYAGKETADFKILAKSIAAKDIAIEDIVVNYNKRVQKAVPTLTWNGKKLRNKTDFTVEYPDLSGNADAYKVPGTYTILVKGKGNYGGERKVSLLITESKLMSKVTVSKIAAQPYTGEEITVATMDKTPTVKSGRTVLRKDVHYTVSYEDNVEIGNAVMILTGTGRETPEGTYTGKKRVTFKITGGNIKKAAVTGIPKSMVYTGTAINEASPGWGNGIKLSVTEKNKEIKELTEGVDYTLEYQKNTDCGTAQIIFTGINGYSGTLKKSFRITTYDIQRDTGRLLNTVIEGQPVYAKGGCKPKPVVKFADMLLEEGRDYTLSYKNNKAVTGSVSGNKIPTVTIKGKGNFKGSISLTYTIVLQNIGNLKLIISDKVFKNRENAFKAVPKVIDLDGKVLRAGTDYEKYYNYRYGADTKLINGSMRKKGDVISEYDILPVNTPIEMTVTGKNNYRGTLMGQYRITAADIAKAKVTIPAQIYSGSEITLDKSQLTVQIGQMVLLPEDYEIEEDSYTNNVKKGNASVTIKGVGNYGGRKTVKFKIKAKSMLWWWR